jgi:hypothetical protein
LGAGRAAPPTGTPGPQVMPLRDRTAEEP